MKTLSILMVLMLIVSGMLIFIPKNANALPVTAVNEEFEGTNIFSNDSGTVELTSSVSVSPTHSLRIGGSSFGWGYSHCVVPNTFDKAQNTTVTFFYYKEPEANYETIQAAAIIGNVTGSNPFGIGICEEAPYNIFSTGVSGSTYSNTAYLMTINPSQWYIFQIELNGAHTFYDVMVIDVVTHIIYKFQHISTFGAVGPVDAIHFRQGFYGALDIDNVVVIGAGFITGPPQFVSYPLTTIGERAQYSYRLIANQPGTFALTVKPSWLTLFGGDTIIGTAPEVTADTKYTVTATITNANGTGTQTFTLTVMNLNPHFVSVALYNLKPGASNYSVLVNWQNTDHGNMLTPAGTYIDQLSAQFQPTYPYQVYMQLNLNIYDNLTQIYQLKFNQVVTDGNPATIYTYYTGVPNNIKLTTEANHFYYFTLDMKISNQTLPIPSQAFSGSVTNSIPASAQQNWIGGILWILILFSIPWIMNFFFPRYGFLTGMILMAILLSIATPSFIYVGLIIVLVTAIEGYALSKSGV